jgi:hypothetical protein
MMEALFGPAWPSAFFEWLKDEEEWHDVSVLGAAWTDQGFLAETIVDGRMKRFIYRPTEWQCGVAAREKGQGVKHGTSD